MDGWLIWVGKNSKANDELTLKYAKKNDLWLHAKDVPGSHVVVKEKPGQNYPEYIIEKAAGLAAANSKRKTDTLCPVIYTPKKFVRKMKGAPAGQVIVEKEEVVMVEPSTEV
ncbi:MAG: NFACT RNA binding domain-containing protein [Bacteroidota bacterium]